MEDEFEYNYIDDEGEYGYAEGDICNRDGCDGEIEFNQPEESCSCHINPPCSVCTTPHEYCPKCGWDAQEEDRLYHENLMKDWDDNPERLKYYEEQAILREQVMKDFENNISNLEFKSDKLDYRSESHTHFSMKFKGMFPLGMTRDEIAKVINSTFGGRFTYFDEKNGRFEYIGYTD